MHCGYKKCPIYHVPMRAAVQREKQQELDGLPDSYYQEDVNTVLQELQRLPVDFTVQHLDDIVEARASVLEVRELSNPKLRSFGSCLDKA